MILEHNKHWTATKVKLNIYLRTCKIAIIENKISTVEEGSETHTYRVPEKRYKFIRKKKRRITQIVDEKRKICFNRFNQFLMYSFHIHLMYVCARAYIYKYVEI